MSSRFKTYQSPLTSRYTDATMQELFGDTYKFSTWRKLWHAMARAQHSLGAPVTWEQVQELGEHTQITDEEILAASTLEKEVRHDVIAHSRTYGATCPLAAPIIHLACTSMYVCDNTDLIIMRQALDMVIIKIARCLDRMDDQASKWAEQPTLAYTHLQAAQPTTVGKRIAMWMQDLLLDYQQLCAVRDNLWFLGAKGATGTQDSYLKLFQGDASKVRKLDQMVTEAFGFNYNPYVICGQTYTRKIDAVVLSALAGVATSVHKMMLDLRILQHLKEIEEPYGKNQGGSSTMAYKRNPMAEERACGLARHLMALNPEAHHTHAQQIFERTLDDSAPRRIYIPEAFLTADAILTIVQNVFEGIVVNPRMIEKHLRAELPFMVTEEIIDALVKIGKDRTECYEKLRVISQEAGRQVKHEGLDNPFLELVRADPYFADVLNIIDGALNPNSFIGRAPEQTREFLEHQILPILTEHGDELEGKSELRV